MQRRVFASSISIAALAICVLATCVNAQVPAGPPGAKPLGLPAQGPGFGQALPRKLDAVGGIVIGGGVLVALWFGVVVTGVVVDGEKISVKN